MNRFRQGVLVGFALSLLAALLIALNLSDERQRKLSRRLEGLRNALPEVEQLKQSVQQAVTKTRETGSNLGEQAQESASKLAHRTQELLSTSQRVVASLKVGKHTTDTVPVEGLVDQATE